jgi:hypothetical protein
VTVPRSAIEHVAVIHPADAARPRSSSDCSLILPA